jgi:MoaA/NifB/PqqE/SkfB family radical SAM enzyme
MLALRGAHMQRMQRATRNLTQLARDPFTDIPLTVNMTQEYLQELKINNLPRLPLEGSIDFTYRCNNNCRHCWLRIPSDVSEKKAELNFAQIIKIADAARKMGCRQWSISGGEPMLRPDFAEIFDYLTSNSSFYSINTNGTLITLKIAKLLKRKGVKMVALYGATKDVHDHVTRNPGSFEATMRGFAYLKEAGAGFMVQIIPMQDNYHQFQDMVKLAESLSRHYRVGAAWLYLSACADKERNAEIIRQRLPPKEVVKLDKPDLSYEEIINKEANLGCRNTDDKRHLFSSCISSRRDFHIDSYGKMTFCCFIKDPSLRYDLIKGSFQDCWDNFIPSLTTKIKITEGHKKNCGSCNLRKDCRICPVYAYLEHRDFNKKVEYLCAVAKENKKFKANWQKNHRRYFKIADVTVRVESDLPIKEDTFNFKFKLFEVAGPGEDTINIRHHFSLPDLDGKDLGREFYRNPPWAIYKNNGSWVYLGISPDKNDSSLHRVVTFNSEHTRAEIYNAKSREDFFLKGNLHSLTMFPSDQVLLARILADREAFYLHSCGVNLQGKGLLFAGHSEAGKSTMARMLKGQAEILCDDRMILRKQHDGFRIYGTWSHGDVPDVSANFAPLRAIMFLEKADENRIILLTNKKEITKQLLSYLIKPFVTADWWEKTLVLIEKVADQIPCYTLKFDKSGKVLDILRKL